MGLAILGVIALLYIALAYMGSRTWPIWHVVLLVFLFLSSLTLMLLSAATLRTQDKWRTQYEAASKGIENEVQRNDQLTNGSVTNNQPGEVQLRGEINRLLVNRGRVWRNLRVAELGDGLVLLDPSDWSDAGCRIANTSDEETTTAPGEVEAAAEEAPATNDGAAAEAGADAAAAEAGASEEGAEGGTDATGSEAAPPAEAAGEADQPATENPAAPSAAPTPVPAPPAPVVAKTAPGLEVGAVVYAFKQIPLSALPAPIRKVALLPPRVRLSTDGAASPDAASEEDAGADSEASDVANSADDSTEVADSGAGGVSSEETAASEEGEVSNAVVEACPVPTYFLGEYKVVENPEGKTGAITLAPTIPLSDDQIQQLQDNQASWVLYEVMPADDHETFAGLTAEQVRLLLPPEGMRDETTYNGLIQEYVRDGGSATDQDAPERKVMQVKFTQGENVDVDVEVTGDGGQSLDDAVFDESGRTLIPSLRQGEPTAFQAGDVATLDFPTAQELINQGKATPVQPVYSRRLRDYAQSIHSLAATTAELDLQVDAATSDLAKIDQTLTAQQNELTFQTERQGKFTGDRDGLVNEVKVLTQYRESAESKLAELRSELSRLYRMNRQLVGQMTGGR